MVTYLLVHGAFRGPWWWERVAERLRAAGHEVVSPSLSGLGERAGGLQADQNVDVYTEDLLAELRGRDLRNVTLVAHSFSGLPATVAADREASRIDRLVYLDAVVPEHGRSNADLFPASVAGWVAGVAETGWRIAPPPVEVLAVNAADREDVRQRMTPMPLAAFLQRIVLSGAVEALPREFVLATGWAANPYRAQAERLAGTRGWTVAEIGTGHEVMLDAPDEVAELLLRPARPSRGSATRA